ncbi:hypothetical protein GCM10020295_07480 [Streptomyces cinereospinus]
MDEPSGQVDWSAGAVELLTEAREWPRDEHRPRRAGVSSFGLTGTNAHVIVEEPPAVDAVPAPEDVSPVAWVVSGKTPEALTAQAEQIRSHVAQDESLRPADIARTLAGRARFEHRAVVVGGGPGGVVAGSGRGGGCFCGGGQARLLVHRAGCAAAGYGAWTRWAFSRLRGGVR